MKIPLKKLRSGFSMPALGVGMWGFGGEGAGLINVPTKVGVLPVKIVLPDLGKAASVQNYLITEEKPLRLSVVLLADWVKYFLRAIAAAAEFLAFRRYKELGAAPAAAKGWASKA